MAEEQLHEQFVASALSAANIEPSVEDVAAIARAYPELVQMAQTLWEYLQREEQSISRR